MRALAQGKKNAASKAILCLLECTMGTQFEAFLDPTTLNEIGTVMAFDVTFDKKDKIDLMTDDKLNKFGETEQKQGKNLTRVDEAEDEGPTQSELEAEFMKRKQQMKKVCIVEEDIKLTNEEKEQLMEMKKERDREEAERVG